MRNATTASLQRVEFALVCGAVFLAPCAAFRHPALFFTLSDLLFVLAISLRLLSGWPLRPLGSATLFWYTGFILLNYGLLVSSLFNGDMTRAWIIFAQYLFAYVGLPLSVSRNSYEESITLAKCAVFGMVAMCAFGIAAYLWGHNGGYQRQFAIVTGSGRLSGLVDNANVLAGYIALTFPLIWYLASVKAFRLPTTIVTSGTLFWALILTSSNTGLLSTLVGATTFLVFRGRFKLLALAGLIAVLFIVAVQLWGEHFLPAVFQRRVLGAVTEGDITEAGTFVSRYELMKEAWRLADTHLLIGMGADQYREISELGLPVHNVYLLLLNEGGLFALCGFLLMLGSTLIAPFQGRRGPTGSAGLLCTITILATFGIIAMSNPHMYARFFPLPLLLAVSLTISASKRTSRLPIRTMSGRGQARGQLALAQGRR